MHVVRVKQCWSGLGYSINYKIFKVLRYFAVNVKGNRICIFKLINDKLRFQAPCDKPQGIFSGEYNFFKLTL